MENGNIPTMVTPKTVPTTDHDAAAPEPSSNRLDGPEPAPDAGESGLRKTGDEHAGSAVTLDTLLDQLGSPGVWQIIIYLLLCLNVFPVSLNFMAMSFFGTQANQTCLLPPGTPMNTSIPRKSDGTYDGCSMYIDPGNMSAGTESCTDGYTYNMPDGRVPITVEWDLVCDKKYMGALAQSIFFAGVMIGGLLFGYLGDEFGRRPVVLVTLYSQAALGVTAAFSTSYVMFVILKFFQGMMLQGLQTSNNTLVMELFQTRFRTRAGMGVAMLATSSSMVIGLISYLLPEWRNMQLAISVPTIITLVFLWVLPESLRWLLSKQKSEAAMAIVRKCVKINRITMPEDLSRNIDTICQTFADGAGRGVKTNVRDLMKTPALRKTSFILFYGWFTASVVYYGIALSIPQMGGHASLNFFISGALETVARFIGYFIINRFGRRIPLTTSFIMAGILCIVSGCVKKAFEGDQTISIITTILALFGKACMGQVFAFILIVTSEVFPTVLRTVGSGACSFWSRVGVIFASQAVLLAAYVGQSTPYILFGALAILAGCLTLFVPETLNVPLPDKVKEADAFHNTANANAPVTKPTAEGNINLALQDEEEEKTRKSGDAAIANGSAAVTDHRPEPVKAKIITKL